MAIKKEEVFVKRVGIGLACLVVGSVSVKAQFLGGIFSQGSTELKNSTTQLALLEALSGSTDEGYSIFEEGLTNTATITGAEYGLHQIYFANLAAVNPAVAGMPEVTDIINLADWIGDGFPAAVDRWRNSGRLTAAELGYVDEVLANSAQRVASILGQLKELLTAGESSMTDADRMRRVALLDRTVREEYGFMLDFIAGGDRLVAERQIELR
jgi:hypothetical protein